MDSFFQSFNQFFAQPDLGGAYSPFLSYLVYFTRFILPIAAIAILTRCAYSMLRERYEPEVWGYLDLPDGSRVPLRHWECTVGRARSSDVTLDSSNVAATQLVLIRDEFGNWTVTDIGHNDGVEINGVLVPEEGARLEDGDLINIGECEMRFFNLTEEERGIISKRRTSPGKLISPGAMFRFVSIFQFLLLYQLLYYSEEEYRAQIALSFVSVFIIMWLYYIIMRAIGRRGFEVEALAFFLSTIGLSVAASSVPGTMLKQVLLLLAGIALFIILGWWLRDLNRVKAMRFPAAAAAVGLLAVNVVFGSEMFGAKNWLSIGGFSFQPSELVKIAYIYAGAATMDRLYRGKNLFAYIAFSAVCVGALALMGDFGSALVFFATFLVISFMRSGNIATVILAISGAGLAGFLALSVRPHIAARFATWGHVWEDVNGAGFQQTRALSAAASGGLFGLGAGHGWLHSIVAADTDLVFGLVTEELGYVIAICAIAAIIVLAAFVVHNASQGRSAFYVIAGTAAVSMMMVQLGLNVFGSLDLLPFTGVTFPFVSIGGSSLISCWALLAFIKATDTRKSASFIIKDPSRMHDFNEFSERYEEEYDDSGTDESDNSPIKAQDNIRNLFDRSDEKRGRGK
ncbi:MAG: FtsW/RodA/SpoVE family cell cycle protein [Oscillospiraceae bacterium]|nr:FtsW/RodA/SpoVE family cell cycle protein [Oscillospiraceae bacterium]